MTNVEVVVNQTVIVTKDRHGLIDVISETQDTTDAELEHEARQHGSVRDKETHFENTVKNVHTGARDTFLGLEDRLLLNMTGYENLKSIGGAPTFIVGKAHERLNDYARDLAQAFEGLIMHMRGDENPFPRIREAIDDAVEEYLFMMRGLVLRRRQNDLRWVAAGAI